MAREPKDLLQQVLGRITELPGADSLLDGLNGVRDRVDDLQKRVRGLDALEKRVEELERKIEGLTADPGRQAKSGGAKSSGGPKAPKKATPGAKRTASALGKKSGNA